LLAPPFGWQGSDTGGILGTLAVPQRIFESVRGQLERVNVVVVPGRGEEGSDLILVLALIGPRLRRGTHRPNSRPGIAMPRSLPRKIAAIEDIEGEVRLVLARGRRAPGAIVLIVLPAEELRRILTSVHDFLSIVDA
jgi:hypothetical protein